MTVARFPSGRLGFNSSQRRWRLSKYLVEPSVFIHGHGYYPVWIASIDSYVSTPITDNISTSKFPCLIE